MTCTARREGSQPVSSTTTWFDASLGVLQQLSLKSKSWRGPPMICLRVAKTEWQRSRVELPEARRDPRAVHAQLEGG